MNLIFRDNDNYTFVNFSLDFLFCTRKLIKIANERYQIESSTATYGATYLWGVRFTDPLQP
jgi:hypothetical protein